MECPHCKEEIIEGAIKCKHCGSVLTECPYCKEYIMEGAIKCKHCGSVLTSASSGQTLTSASSKPTLSSSQLYLSHEGRITRSTLWYKLLIPYFVISLIIGLLGNEVLMGAFVLIILYPSLVLYIKRLHDRDRSGWFLFLTLIPVIGLIWFIIELGFLKGTEGSNKYGDDPLSG